MNIGERIRECRKRRGYTQKELAEKSGVATISIQQYERCVRQPRIGQLQLIANALEISIYELMGLTDVEAWNAALNANIDFILTAERIHTKFGLSLDLANKIVDEIADLMQDKLRSEAEAVFQQLLNRLTEAGQQKGIEYLEDLSGNPKYRRSRSPAEPQKEPQAAQDE